MSPIAKGVIDMIQTITAHTIEIDDIDIAVQEIVEQLPAADSLLPNTVGILACHYEFVFSGVVEALCAALPFEVVGAITSAQATPATADGMLLTLMVLTSDEVTFRVGLSDSLLGAPADVVEDVYNRTALPGEKPALILPYAAFLPQNSGDDYVAVLSKLSGNAPLFGTLAVDDTQTFENCFAIHNGQHYRDKMALLLMYGNLSPRFCIATISKDKIVDRPALITKSHGHILEEINGRPLMEYFESFDLAEATKSGYAMSSIPFLLDYGDGTPFVSKVFIQMTPDNNGLFAGQMPEGSTMYMGVFDRDDVLLTTGNAVQEALGGGGAINGALAYSCVARYMSLGGDTLAELTHMRALLGTEVPFMMAYSGGEICPTQVRDDVATNRFHNDSFILCVF